jgi:hypothetical protein
MQAWATQGRARSASRQQSELENEPQMQGANVVEIAEKGDRVKGSDAKDKKRPLPLPPLPQVKNSSG